MKNFNQIGFLVPLLTFSVVATADNKPDNNSIRPNVVFIISDEHQVDALGCYGSDNYTLNGESPTPNIDKLAARGVIFTNAYTPSPLCAPARASIITGVYPNVHTALHHKENNLEPGYNRFPGILPELPTIADAFRDAGYLTAAIGKMHVHGEVKDVNDLGFSYSDLRFYTYFPGKHYDSRANGDWYTRYRELAPYFNKKYRDIDSVRFSDTDIDLTPKKNKENKNFVETLVEKDNQVFDNLVAEESGKYISECVSQKKPFFIHVGLEKPHQPYTTHKRYMDMFPPEKMILPETWDEINERGQYPFLMDWLAFKNSTQNDAKNTMAAYYSCVREMDEQVGKIIQKCEDLGIMDNTIFVYTSDHGDNMYTHSLMEKHCMFEMSSKVPLIISYPKSLSVGKKSDKLVSLLDVMPTILELSGQSVPESFEGISLLKTLEGKISSERTVFSEFYEAGGNYKMFPEAKSVPMRMCRYKNYKYVYTHGFIEQLYDLKRDPQEMNNLVFTAFDKNKALIEKLRLTTFSNWKIDEFPLIDVAMKRAGGAIEFSWQPSDEITEYILYRSTSPDPLQAEELARGFDAPLTDKKPIPLQESYYWLIAVPKLERTFDDAILYANVPVATQTLSSYLPASLRMTASPGTAGNTVLPEDNEDEELYGFKALEYSNNKNDYNLPYRLYVPEDYQEGKNYPLVIFLHGAGKRGSDNVSQIKAMSGPLAFVNPEVQKKYPSIVLAPQCPKDDNWIWEPYSGGITAESLEDVKPSAVNLMLMDLLQNIQDRYDIDADRIYLTGQSMGGIGTWFLSLMNPNMFAAIAPVCGMGIPSEVSVIADMPVWAFHGAEDKTIPPDGSRKMVKALKEAGSTVVKYTEYPNVGHESWTKAYTEDTDNNGEVDLIEWMFSKKRK